MIGKTISHFKILAKLGEGGMGTVYKAEDTRLHRYVAIKMLPDRLIQNEIVFQRFRQEAQAASALNHQSICTIYDIGEDSGIHFIVMEYADGKTLGQVIEERGALPEKEVIDIGQSICQALIVAHDKNIIHRDIKPENIIITDDGVTKVMDFGLAKVVNGGTKQLSSDEDLGSVKVDQGGGVNDSPITSHSTYIGTPGYMAPEQIVKDELDARLDLFSLGVVMHEMLTGKAPFKAAEAATSLEQTLDNEVDRPSQLSPGVSLDMDALVGRLLVKDKSNRYQSAGEVLAALKRLHSRRPYDWLRKVAAILLPAIALGIALIIMAASKPKGTSDTIPRMEFTATSWDPYRAMAITEDRILGSTLVENSGKKSTVFFWSDLYSGDRQEIAKIPGDFADIVGDYSPSQSKFVFSDGWRKSGIYVLDLTAQAIPIKISDFGYGPKWSPDGKQVVFSTANPNLPGEMNAIHVYDLESGSVKIVSPSNGLQFGFPSWSPTGRWILCTAGFGSKWDLWLVDPINNDHSRQLTSFERWIRNPLWSPLDQSIYYTQNDDNLWRARVDENDAIVIGNPVKISSGSNITYLMLTADSTRIFLRSSVMTDHFGRAQRSDEGRKYEPLPGLYPSIETPDIQVSPDGKRIVIEVKLDGNNALMVRSIFEDQETIVYKDRAAYSPSWSSDGDWIAFDAGGGDNADIWRIPADGGEAEPVISHDGADWLPTYSPDGKYLCFLSNRTGQFDLWLLDLTSMEQSRLTNTANLESRGFWSPDASKLAFFGEDSKGTDFSIWLLDLVSKNVRLLRRLDGEEFIVTKKLAWLSNEIILFNPRKDLGFRELSIITGNERIVLTDNIWKGLNNITSSFSVFESTLYFAFSQAAHQWLVAEINPL